MTFALCSARCVALGRVAPDDRTTAAPMDWRASHADYRNYAPPPLWPCVTFTLRVVVSTSRPGVFVMTEYRALIRPSGEDAMGRSCLLDSPPQAGGCPRQCGCPR